MAALLERYKAAIVRHPSWRIYKALADIKERLPELKEKKIFDPEDLDSLSPKVFGLKEDIEVFFPYAENDELTNNIIAAIINPDYTDNGKFGIEECMSIFCDIENRQLLEGMLMIGEIPSDIAIDLGYRKEIVETYASVFYDTSVWRSSSDKIFYLKHGVIGTDATIKNAVQDNGIDYVGTTYYKRPAKVRMDKALADLFGRYYKSVVQTMGSMEPEEQESADRQAKRMIEIFKELKNASKADGGIRELTIALQTESAPTKGIDDLN